jgi:tRNA(His) 5'-end guanylyltransferase
MAGHCAPFFAFSFSDEVTLLFRKDDEQYARRIEKLDSLIASALSSLFTKRIGTVAFFDARVLLLPKFSDVIRYLTERQAETQRNCVNEYTFHSLVRTGLSPEQAGERMRGWNFRRMTRYLLAQQILYGKLPLWQKRGVAFYWETHRKPGFNPVTGEQTFAVRFKLRENERLPRFDSKPGRRLVRKALEARNCEGSWI